MSFAAKPLEGIVARIDLNTGLVSKILDEASLKLQSASSPELDPENLVNVYEGLRTSMQGLGEILETVEKSNPELGHELKNELHVLLANVEAAVEPSQMRLVHMSRAYKVLDSISKLLGAAVIPDWKPELYELDLNAKLRQRLDLLSPKMGLIQVENNLADNLFPVIANEMYVDWIVNNLVLNAVKHGKPSRLRITTRNIPGVNIASSTSYVLLSVYDDGTGIESDALDSIFEEGYTTHPTGEGRGLYTVAETVKQKLDGHVNVESEPGNYTRFDIMLPAVYEPGKTPDKDYKCTVLLVDDTTVVRDTVSRQLAHLGYRVIQAANVRQARDILDERETEINLVFTDILFDKQPLGLKVGEYAADKGLPVLYTSGNRLDNLRGEYPDKSSHLTNESFLQKPYQIQQLKSAVAKNILATK